MKPEAFTIPSHFSPTGSLLGKVIRSRVDDPRRADSLFFVAATGVTVVLILAHTLGWALLQPTASDRETLFAISAGLGAVAFALTCLVGWRPAIRIHVDDQEIVIRAGRRTRRVPWHHVRSVAAIDAQRYYRMLARYAGTEAYVNRIHAELLHLDLSDCDLVLGLRPEDLHAFTELVPGTDTATLTSSQVA